MMADALAAISTNLQLREKLQDPARYITLDDDVERACFRMDSSEPGVKEARKLIENMYSRKTYKCAQEIIVPGLQSDNPSWIPPAPEEITQCQNSDGLVCEFCFCRNVLKYIWEYSFVVLLKFRSLCIETLVQVNLIPNDIRLAEVCINYGKQADNPILHVKFFDYCENEEEYRLLGFPRSERDRELRKPYEVWCTTTFSSLPDLCLER